MRSFWTMFSLLRPKKTLQRRATIAMVLVGVLVQQAQAWGGSFYREFGNDHGLTDLEGREIVPPIYPYINYLGHGLFLLFQRNPNPDQGVQCLSEKLLINRKGIKLKTKIPQNASFEGIFWLGDQAENKKNFVPDTLPDDALLKFRINNNSGICDKDGQIILPASFPWIGTAREGTAVVRREDNKLFVFDAKSRQQNEVSSEVADNGGGMAFGEGLAPFRNPELTGYIDKLGKVAIAPKFHWAVIFEQGQAFVNILSADGKNASGAIINRMGDIISPPTLDIREFYGDYAVAGVGNGKFGVVNRKFEFVIQPEYETLIPQAAPYYSEEDAWSLHAKPPMFFYAVKHKGDRPLVLSVNGKVLFELPETVHLPNWPPYVRNSVIVCPVWIDPNHKKDVFLNMQGKEVAAPYSTLSKSKSVNFREIA
ncbi:MAG: WG repeat-containing protein, partial [Leptolyngbya sp.]|nr:WG repeat-containing protein [Candidatus Melainabacteria bacterium]